MLLQPLNHNDAMNRVFLLAVIVPLLAGLRSGAQTNMPADTAKPASSNIIGQQYPQIDSNLRATFQLRAPDAQKVRLHLDKDYDMERGTNCVWTVTTSPQAPGFHYYWFILDGVNICDPASETFFGVGRQYSGIEVPSKGEDFYEAKDVPHGEVRSKWYHSNITGAWRRVFVYTPPDYDTNPTARYPVLYLQPGFGEDERGWKTQGRVSFILDNLIAAKKAKPMLVVMDNQFSALKPGEAPLSFGERRPGGGGRPDFGSYGLTFTQVMLGELMPAIESSYRALSGREHRAMAGLSMGGMQTFLTTLPHLDQFAYIGGFSPGLPQAEIEKIYKDAEGFNRQVKLLWIGTGTVERDSNPNILRLHEALDKAGINHVYFESPGTAYEWLTWRGSLNDFAPRLFQD
jgi:enterochelin esterase family protein